MLQKVTEDIPLKAEFVCTFSTFTCITHIHPYNNIKCLFSALLWGYVSIWGIGIHKFFLHICIYVCMYTKSVWYMFMLFQNLCMTAFNASTCWMSN